MAITTQELAEILYDIKNEFNNLIELINTKLVARDELQQYETLIDLKLNDIESRLQTLENRISDLETRVTNLENA